MARDLDDRLLGLLASRATWQGPRLADELGVSIRTIRRALVRLEARGVVLEAERGRGGGVRLVATGTIGRLDLQGREGLDLLLALAIAQSIASPLLMHDLRPLRQKLSAVFPAGKRRELTRLRRRVLVGAPASEAVRGSWREPRAGPSRIVRDAFFDTRVIDIEYAASSKQDSWRRIEPQYLLVNVPAWYVLAYDVDRAAGRTFRLDRISRVIPTEVRFATRSAISLSEDVERYFVPT